MLTVSILRCLPGHFYVVARAFWLFLTFTFMHLVDAYLKQIKLHSSYTVHALPGNRAMTCCTV